MGMSIVGGAPRTSGGCLCGAQSTPAPAVEPPRPSSQAAADATTGAGVIAAGTRHDHSAMPGMTPATAAGNASGFVAGRGGSGYGIRDADAARANLESIRRTIANLQTPQQLIAAGYRQNPKNPDHWHNYSLKDPTDLAHPASVVVRDGRTIGVMIASPKGQPVPDFGAGGWHAHSSDNYNQLHVWVDKPFERSYGTPDEGMAPDFG